MNDNERYELMKGDCLERMKEIPDGSVDMILCDLPYGTTACKWDVVIPFEPLWVAYKRVCKKNAAIVLTASQPFTSALVMSNITDFKVEWIWKKSQGSNFTCVKHVPLKEHESTLVFSSGSPVYNPQMTPRSESGKARKKYKHFSSGTNGIYGKIDAVEIKTDHELRFPSSVLFVNNERGLHPTQKPVALFEYLILTYTNENYIVLDNCMGSGTTGVACANTNRRFIGIERDETYFINASKRIVKSFQTTQLTLELK